MKLCIALSSSDFEKLKIHGDSNLEIALLYYEFIEFYVAERIMLYQRIFAKDAGDRPQYPKRIALAIAMTIQENNSSAKE